jgi:hypothetical protein
MRTTQSHQRVADLASRQPRESAEEKWRAADLPDACKDRERT